MSGVVTQYLVSTPGRGGGRNWSLSQWPVARVWCRQCGHTQHWRVVVQQPSPAAQQPLSTPCSPCQHVCSFKWSSDDINTAATSYTPPAAVPQKVGWCVKGGAGLGWGGGVSCAPGRHRPQCCHQCCQCDHRHQLRCDAADWGLSLVVTSSCSEAREVNLESGPVTS